MLRIGLGQAEGVDTETVVRQVISACNSEIEGQVPQAGILFAGPQFDHQSVLNLINDAYPGIELIGCTTAGSFSTAYGFSDDDITLMVMCSDDLEISAGVGRNLTNDYRAAVIEAVAMARPKIHREPSLCLTFPEAYDVRFEPVLKTLGAELGAACPIFGGASATQWEDGTEILQFYRREVLTNAIPILLIAGPIKHAFAIANSWRPLGKKALVTEAQGRLVRKLDQMKAVDFYRHYLGYHNDVAKEFVLAVYERGRDEFYIRAPMEYHHDGSVMFSESIPEGAQVQLAEATREDLIQDTLATTRNLKESLADWEPALVIAFSCGYRKEILGTVTQKELEILKATFRPGTPIMGFYSYGEIAPLVPGGESYAHGATLVNLLLGPLSTSSLQTVEDSTVDPRAVADEDLQHSRGFLIRKLQRSEAYRKRMEFKKDSTSRMHRRIIEEIDAARQQIQLQEAALRKSEEKFRRIVQTTGEGFILMDESLKIIDANDAFCQMVGYPRSDILGQSKTDLAAAEFSQYLASNREALLAEEYSKFEGSLATKDGHLIPVLVHGNTLRDDKAEVIGHMAFITDISEQKKALALAGEVQRSLLPQENPQVPGLDVAGRNVSCDEVGGDYFDFFWRRGPSESPFSVAVGDIAGHGVDAALLMTSARAFLRLHASQDEPVSEIICAANKHLVEDVMETGRFMTLFYLTIAPDLNSMEWVRAGHDPAIIYDPVTDDFEDLAGPGIALGIDDSFPYKPNSRSGLRDGQVIAIGTDGIWESYNNKGEMFGRKRLKALLRQYAHHTAGEILNVVFNSLGEFSGGRKSDDDITLVVIKIQKESNG